MVLCNSRFRHINQYSEADTKPGICTYESLGRLDAAHGTLGRRLLSFAQRVGKLRRTGNSETIEHLGDRILERRQSITPEGGIVSIQTDISERKRAEEALREQTKAIELLHKVASDANRAQNVEEALQGCLDAVCAHTGWPVGHVYVRSTDERDKLLPSKIWHLDGSKRFAAFRKVTERTTFEPGVGLPGRVLASGKSAWITDVTEDPNFPRAKLAKDIGVKAGFAVPVLVETDVVAVLEFFSPEAVEPDEELLNLLDNVGGQVGRVIERKRADQELAEKEAQLHLALDHMPGGMTLEDRDGNYVLFNAQYSELHDYPEGFLKVGMHSREEVLFQAERGDLGLGNKDELVEQVLGLYPGGKATSWERTFPDGRTLRFNVAPTPEGGTVTIVTEITELKRREQELAAKEAQLRVALDHMPGGMELVDGDRNYVFFNSQYSELHDYPDGLLKVGGSVLDETRFQVERGDYGPGDPDKLMEEAHAPFKSGETGSYERTLPGGRTLYFNVAPTPDGGYVTIVTEITERKRAEQALAEKEAHLRVALDNMPGLLVYTDEDLNIVLCNERFSELYQAQREMLQPGQPYAEFLRCLAEQGYYGEGDAEALVSERIESLRNPSGQTFEELAPDGRVRRSLRSRAAGGGTVTVVTDITELKRREQELAEKEAQLRVALDNMPGGMKLIDGDRKYVLFNPKYIELHDYPDGLLKVGGSILDEARFQAERGDYGPGDPDKLMEESLVPYESGEPESYERTLPGGRTLQFYSAPTPEGGFVSIVTDITERKLAEQELAEKEAQLRVALDNMPGGIRLVDGNRNFVLCNQQYFDLFDLPEGLFKVGDSIRVENLYCAQRGDMGPGDPETLSAFWESPHWYMTKASLTDRQTTASTPRARNLSYSSS